VPIAANDQMVFIFMHQICIIIYVLTTWWNCQTFL